MTRGERYLAWYERWASVLEGGLIVWLLLIIASKSQGMERVIYLVGAIVGTAMYIRIALIVRRTAQLKQEIARLKQEEK